MVAQPGPTQPEPPATPQDLRARLRAAILSFLSRHQETQVVTVLDTLKQAVPTFGRTEESAALEILHELVTANIIMPGLDRGHLGWPWLRLTEYGRQVVRQGRPVPFDPDQYLGAVQQRLAALDPLVLDVLRESVATYHRGFVRSSALLLGIASEILILELVEAFIGSRPDKERQRLERLIEDKSIYAKYRIFREEMEKGRDSLRLPDALSKDIDAIIGLIFNAVRINRNEAGHPSGAPLNSVLVATTLLAFLEYADRVVRLIAFLQGSRGKQLQTPSVAVTPEPATTAATAAAGAATAATRTRKRRPRRRKPKSAKTE